MIAFIDDHREAYGVEPICKVLPIAPSTYHALITQRIDASKRATTPCWNNLPWRRDSNQMASDEPGAVHRTSLWFLNFSQSGDRPHL
jgi:hypothetical protein